MKKNINNLKDKNCDSNHLTLSHEIAEKIQSLLSVKKISVTEFATQIGESESHIQEWLSGTFNFTLEIIAKIQQVLQEPIIQLYQSPKHLLVKYTHELSEQATRHHISEVNEYHIVFEHLLRDIENKTNLAH